MTERNLDMKLKALLSEEDIEVPRKVSLGIEATLSSIQKKNRIGTLKRGVKAAAILFILVLGLASAFPVVADNIPIINKILGEDSLFGLTFSSQETEVHFSNLSEVRNHAIAVDKSAGEIIVREFAYDGVAFYTVWEIGNTSIESMNRYDSSVIINNQQDATPGVFIPELLNDGTVRVIQVYPIPVGLHIPDEATISIRFYKDGTWLSDISFEIDKGQLLASIKSIDLDNRIRLGLTTAHLRSITQSPAYISLNMTIGSYKPNKYEFVLFDDQGNELQQVDMGRVERSGLSTELTLFYKAPLDGNTVDRIQVLAANASNSYRQLNLHSSSSIRTKTDVELDTKLPVSVSIGDGREITVTSIDSDAHNLRIVLNATEIGMNTFIRMGGISLYDSSQRQNYAYKLRPAEALGGNQYLLTYLIESFDLSNTVLRIGDYDELLTVVHEIRAQ